MKNFNMNAFMRLLGKNTVIRSMIPLGFKAGAPLIRCQGDKVLLTVPYARYKTTGNIDGTLVYPMAYAATFVALPEPQIPESLAAAAKGKRTFFPGKLVSFRALSFDPAFADVNFGKPIDTFRHEAIKGMSREQYEKEILTLYAAYEKVVGACLAGEAPAAMDKMNLKQLLGELIVPNQKAMYQKLDDEFYQTYLA